jgi:hypothetical protein
VRAPREGGTLRETEGGPRETERGAKRKKDYVVCPDMRSHSTFPQSSMTIRKLGVAEVTAKSCELSSEQLPRAAVISSIL